MWLVFAVLVLVPVLIFVGIISGGIFTAILILLAAVVGIGAFIYAFWARATGATSREQAEANAESVPDVLPHSGHTNAAATPSTPGQLVDARRQQQ